jgi:predicted DNA-binding transcriptional regulator YafY
MSQPDHLDPLELLTLQELTAKTKRSRRSLYRDIDAGLLRTVKLGRRTMVPRVEAERYVYGGNGCEPDE